MFDVSRSLMLQYRKIAGLTPDFVIQYYQNGGDQQWHGTSESYDTRRLF